MASQSAILTVTSPQSAGLVSCNKIQCRFIKIKIDVIELGSTSTTDILELWQSVLGTNGCWPVCRFNLVFGNYNNRSRHRHSESTIQPKRFINSWSLHSWYDTRGESYLFGIMLYTARINHELWLSRQSKNDYTWRYWILPRTSWNCCDNVGSDSFDCNYHCNSRIDCLLLQKTSWNSRVAGLSKSRWKGPHNVTIALVCKKNTHTHTTFILLDWWRKLNASHHLLLT